MEYSNGVPSPLLSCLLILNILWPSLWNALAFSQVLSWSVFYSQVSVISKASILYSLKFSIMSSSLCLIYLAFSVPILMFLTCSLASWLYVFIWQIFLKLIPCCWILDDMLFLILDFLLYILCLPMLVMDPDCNPSRLPCVICCLICTNYSLVYGNRLLLDCIFGLTYLHLLCFQWVIFELT